MEEWRDIKGYDGIYQISNTGRVKGLARLSVSNSIITEKILKSHTTNRGYLRIGLRKDCKIKKFYVHRLVATAFISNNNIMPQINHINEIKTDNIVRNLEWTTCRENTNYSKNKRSTSKYAGVSWHKINIKWSAQCRNNGKLIHLGCYMNEEDAAQAYICYCAIHNLK